MGRGPVAAAAALCLPLRAGCAAKKGGAARRQAASGGDSDQEAPPAGGDGAAAAAGKVPEVLPKMVDNVWRVTCPSGLSEGAALEKNLRQAACRICGESGKADVWRVRRGRERLAVDVRGGAELASLFRKLGTPEGAQWAPWLRDCTAEVVFRDVNRVILEEKNRVAGAVDARVEFFAEYRRYHEIVTEINSWESGLGAQLDPPMSLEVGTVGRSWKGRDIRALFLGSQKGRVVYTQCGVHGREWMSVAACMYWAHELLQGLVRKDKRITAALSDTLVVLIPVLNPDGYEYTFSSDRLWHKNRRPNAGGSVGVDLDRNWDGGHWRQGCGIASDPADGYYGGLTAFSEQETVAVQSLFSSLDADGRRVAGALSFTGYGGEVLRPYSFAHRSGPCPHDDPVCPGCNPCAPPNDAELKAVGAEMARSAGEAAGSEHHSRRRAGCCGCSEDWLHNRTLRGLGFTVALRPRSLRRAGDRTAARHSGGFFLPTAKIVPTGQEATAAVLSFIEHVNKK